MKTCYLINEFRTTLGFDKDNCRIEPPEWIYDFHYKQTEKLLDLRLAILIKYHSIFLTEENKEFLSQFDEIPETYNEIFPGELHFPWHYEKDDFPWCFKPPIVDMDNEDFFEDRSNFMQDFRDVFTKICIKAREKGVDPDLIPIKFKTFTDVGKTASGLRKGAYLRKKYPKQTLGEIYEQALLTEKEPHIRSSIFVSPGNIRDCVRTCPENL